MDLPRLHFFTSFSLPFKFINLRNFFVTGVGFLRKSILDSLKEEIGKKFKWQSKSERVFQPLMKIPNAHKTKVNGLM